MPESPPKPPLKPSQIPSTPVEHQLAFLLLWGLEYQKNPKLTLPEFRKWLHASHAANVKAAKAQFDANQATKGKK